MASGERCPVCGGTEWDLDYVFNGEDEIPVEHCADCEWPPGMPMSPDEYRGIVAERERDAKF